MLRHFLFKRRVERARREYRETCAYIDSIPELAPHHKAVLIERAEIDLMLAISKAKKWPQPKK